MRSMGPGQYEAELKRRLAAIESEQVAARRDRARRRASGGWLARRQIGKRLVTIVSTASLVFAVFATSVSAHHLGGGPATTTHGVHPIFVGGNPSCTTIGSAGEHSFKINGAFTATDPATGATFTITTYDTSSGPAFDFTVTGGVVLDLIVKGGPNANHYDYDGTDTHTIAHGSGVPHSGAVSSDTFLHAPVNPSNGRFFGLSHLEICYDTTLSKSGTKFHDRNADGDRDTGEEGLANWVIRAYADNNPANAQLDAAEFSAGHIGSATTSATGAYSIALNPGAYIVCEVAQTGWEQSAPANGVCAAGGSTLAAGGWAINLTANDPGNDFGNFQTATKSGTKFEDLDADGVKETGEGAPSVAFTIYAFADADDDETLVDGDDGTVDGLFTPVTSATTSTTDGTYSLTLDPGNYIVCEEAKAGWAQSFPTTTTTNSANCSANSVVAPVGWDVSLSSAGSDTGNDFGNFRASISGTKFKDADGDGSGFETGDPTIEGWEIRLYNDVDGSGDLTDGDTLVDTDTTDSMGNYSFSGLAPGDYIICEVAQADWSQADPDNDVCDQTGLTDGGLLTPALASGGYAEEISTGEAFNADFVNTPLSDVHVDFFDLTGSTDADISCVITGTATTVEDSDTTDESGTPETAVENNGLLPGSYTCTIVITDP